ncbi:MAG TPA: DoxX family protein [bacterium]|nr:DoxX family protein [bacterium]
MRSLLATAVSNSRAADAGLFLLRAFAGLTMLQAHGLRKFPPSEQFIAGVGEMGFPAPEFFAWMASFSEVFGGTLLAIGLLTRPAAFLILCTMLVAGLIRHAPDPFNVKELAFVYAGIALLYLLYGSGRFGLDYLLFNRPGLTAQHAAAPTPGTPPV